MSGSFSSNEIFTAAVTLAVAVAAPILVFYIRRILKVPPEQPVIVLQTSAVPHAAPPLPARETAPAAVSQAEAELWAEVQASGARRYYVFYLNKYPKGFYAVEAENHLLNAAQEENTVPAYEAFLADVPHGERRAVAELKLIKARVARYKAEERIEIGAPFVTNAQGRWFLPGAGKTEWFKDIENGPEMVVVPSGRFQMGSPKDEPQRYVAESPQHEVTIPKAFAIGRYAVTRGEFAAFVAATGHKIEDGALVGTGTEWKDDPTKSWRDPGFAQDDSHPVVGVNWDEAQAYVAWLSKASGAAYHLPSEAQWEYACRAGTTTPFWWGSSITPELANYDGTYAYAGGQKGEYRGRTLPVKSFEPSPWGLYQVHGNVWEWTEDCWNRNYDGAPADHKAWKTGDCKRRVVRGGSWENVPRHLRAANRDSSSSDGRFVSIGFRVARTITP
ncbi:formylglycine-generating enzyme family protein [Rhodomicrobium lacus]|uniref:formylglycine-generating enzyme family protein n=1 Tax=Rhodomicrobium lacus TaxID=2498452 RepID=UPI000F8DE05D|nr:formylglycine-generating enzyme family protein [Rhodomicrobium lacus]